MPEDYMKRKITRRRAISATGKTAIGAVVGLGVGGIAGYLGGISSQQANTVTKTLTQQVGAATVTATVPGPTVTMAQTVTRTATVVSTLTPLSEIQQKYENAKRERELLVYGSLDVEDFTPLQRSFNSKFPDVQVQYLRGSPSELYNRIKSEIGAKRPTADIVIMSLPNILQMKSEGLLDAYKSRELLAYPGRFFDDRGFWSPVVMLPNASVVNTRLLATTPQSIEDVLQATNRGQIIMHNLLQGTASTFMWGQMKNIIGETRWREILERLAALKPVLNNSLSGVTQAVRDGQYRIGFIAYLHDIMKSAEEGAPVRNFWVSELPVMVTINAGALLKDTPHRNAAELMMDYILSAEGQSIFGNISVRFPTRPGVNAKYSAEAAFPGRRLYLYPDEEIVAEAQSLVQTFRSMGFGT
ncbi:MAG: extracellular solute-binding protein [Candidatus Caldarchaeum sp.]|nr:extracellular solute-binding protein [Candidatus Caldarchaeum sp.]